MILPIELQENWRGEFKAKPGKEVATDNLEDSWSSTWSDLGHLARWDGRERELRTKRLGSWNKTRNGTRDRDEIRRTVAFPGCVALFFCENESRPDKVHVWRQSSKKCASRVPRNLREKRWVEKKRLLFISRNPRGTYEISSMFSNTLDIRETGDWKKIAKRCKKARFTTFLASLDSAKSYARKGK